MKKASSKKGNKGSRRNIILAIVLVGILAAIALAFLLPRNSEEPTIPENDSAITTNGPSETLQTTDGLHNDINSDNPNSIEVAMGNRILQFDIPELDERGYPLDQFEMEQWFLDRLNYHRINYGLHPYEIYHPTRAISIVHSLDMRENEFTANKSSDGLTHQERHEIWMGADRTRITSALNATCFVPDGPLTQEVANDIADHLFEREDRHSFIMNPTYYYIGIGFSIDEHGTGRLNLTFTSPPDQRANWHAMTSEEREIYVQEYLERVRAERGWTPPEDTDD